MFQPGNNANPKGRPKLPPELCGVVNITDETLRRTISMVANATDQDIKIMKLDPLTTQRARAVMRLFEKVLNNGCIRTFEGLMNRCIGVAKTVEEVEKERVDAMNEEQRTAALNAIRQAV